MLTNIATVGSDPAVIELLQQAIAALPGYHCICACTTAETALRSIPRHQPHVVFMENELPNISGVECMARLKELLPHTQFLILSANKSEKCILAAFAAGATGFLVKPASSAEVMTALREIRAGGAPMSSEVARIVVQQLYQPAASSEEIQALTPREEDIVNLLAEGYASKEIGS